MATFQELNTRLSNFDAVDMAGAQNAISQKVALINSSLVAAAATRATAQAELDAAPTTPQPGDTQWNDRLSAQRIQVQIAKETVSSRYSDATTICTTYKSTLNMKLDSIKDSATTSQRAGHITLAERNTIHAGVATRKTAVANIGIPVTDLNPAVTTEKSLCDAMVAALLARMDVLNG